MVSYAVTVPLAWLLVCVFTGTWRAVLSHKGARVAYGRDVPTGLMPYFVELRSWYDNEDREKWCGGTLIAPGWVLTSARCVMSDGREPVDGLMLRVNGNNVLRPSSFSVFAPDDFYPDQKWNPGEILSGNVGLIYVEELENLQDMSYPDLPQSGDAVTTAPILVMAGTGVDETMTDDITDFSFVTLSYIPTEEEFGIPMQDGFFMEDAGMEKQGFCRYESGAGVLIPSSSWVGVTDDWELNDQGEELNNMNDVIVGIGIAGNSTYCGDDDMIYLATNVYDWVSWIQDTMAAN